MNKFYLYIYFDPRKVGHYSYPNLGLSFLYEPFYVGKGSGKRAFDHLKLYDKRNAIKFNKIKKILNSGSNPLVQIIRYSKSEQEIFEYEKQFIKSIGRYDIHTGTLCNVTDGGKSTNGYVPTEKQRYKHSQFLKGQPSPKKGIKTGKPSWMKGKKHKPESLQKMSKTWFNKGNISWNKGMKMSEEHCKKLSIAHIGKVIPQSTKDAVSLAHKGRKQSIEWIEKKRNALCKKTYRLISPDKEEFIFKNCNRFAQQHNLNASCIRSLLKGRYKQYNGWTI